MNNIARVGVSLLGVPKAWCNCTQALISTSSRIYDSSKLRRRWVTDEKWQKNRFTNKKWAPNVPMEHNIDPWRTENAYFGSYDFMDILGNDLTLQPELLCKGPSYLRGKRLGELERLIQRRSMYGQKMHAEDLNQAEKRISFLLKRRNRVKRPRTRWNNETAFYIR